MRTKDNKPKSKVFPTTIRSIAGLAIMYTLGDFFIKGLNYLLLPLYLQYLSPEEYGILAITEVLKTLLALLLSFGMSSAILRFIHVVKEEEQRSFFGSMWLFLILIAGIATLVLLTLGSSIFSQLIPSVAFDPYIRKTLIAAFLTSSFAILPATLFRARDQVNNFVAFGSFSALAIASATILHVVILRQEAAGWVQAQLEGAIAIAVVSTLILLKKVQPSFRWSQLKYALAYSLPLLPHFAAHWILSVSDRMILERYIGLTQLGLYTLAYQFGRGYHILITGIHNAFIPLFGRASKDRAEYIILSDMITYYLLTVILLALVIALIGGEVIFLIFPTNFEGAMPLIPWIVLGYLFFAVYNIPMSYLVMTVGKTKATPIATLSAASVNLGLNLLYIPRFGSIAAAVNTAIGYGVLALIMFIIAWRTGPLPIQYKRILRLGFTSVLIYIAGRILMQFDPLINILIGIGVSLTLPILVGLWGFWRADEIRKILTTITRLFERFVLPKR